VLVIIKMLFLPRVRNVFLMPCMHLNSMYAISCFHFSKPVKIDRGDPKRFNLVQRKVDKAQKISPSIREDLNK